MTLAHNHDNDNNMVPDHRTPLFLSFAVAASPRTNTPHRLATTGQCSMQPPSSKYRSKLSAEHTVGIVDLPCLAATFGAGARPAATTQRHRALLVGITARQPRQSHAAPWPRPAWRLRRPARGGSQSLTGEMPVGIKQPSNILRERSCVCDDFGSHSTSRHSFRPASKTALHRRGTQTSVIKTARGVESASKHKKPVAEPTAAVRDASAHTEAHSGSDELHSRYPDFWFAAVIKKVCFNHKSISLFARTTMKTAARAGVSFRAATVVAPVRTFKTTAIRKDEANKENSVHVVHYEKGQRREHDIEVDEAKLVIPAVQDVEIIVVSVAALELDGNVTPIRVLSPQHDPEGFKTGIPWGELCLEDGNGAPIRVPSPQHNPQGFKTYFDKYIDQVWQHITGNGIQFDTQDGNPLVSCHVQCEAMYCDRTSGNTTSSQAPEMCLWCRRCLTFVNTRTPQAGHNDLSNASARGRRDQASHSSYPDVEIIVATTEDRGRRATVDDSDIEEQIKKGQAESSKTNGEEEGRVQLEGRVLLDPRPRGLQKTLLRRHT
ncbi:hypothetical protein Q7P35_001346 [Cladosporium inversicolor]